MRRPFCLSGIMIFFLLTLILSTYAADESLTITTYYPTPQGNFNDLDVSGNLTVGGTVGIGTTDPGTAKVAVLSNVGIGTTAPLSLLHLDSGSSPSGHITFTDSTTGSTASDGFTVGQSSGIPFIWTYENQPLRFGTNNTEQLRIDSNGNVGIGTVSPTSIGSGYTTLDIEGSSGGGIRFGTAGGTDSAYYSGGSISYAGSVSNIPLSFTTNNTRRVTIDTSGNVGIGTTSPTQKLEVNGNIKTPYNFWIGWGTGDNLQFSNNHVFINTEDTTHLFIEEGGNVGIGTTSPSEALEVNGNVTADTYKMNSAKTYYYTIPASDFMPQNPYSSEVRYSSTDLRALSSNITFHAPVHLPDGAVVTAVVVYGNSGAAAETWTLYCWYTTTGHSMASANINTEDTSIDYATIDNEDYGYVISTTSIDVDDSIYKARITYTMDEF